MRIRIVPKRDVILDELRSDRLVYEVRLEGQQ